MLRLRHRSALVGNRKPEATTACKKGFRGTETVERVRVIPGTPIAKAIGYAVNQWASLNVYVRDGRLAIDNNAAERAVKPFAIGRKNWLFFGSDRGGRTLATLASFTATCQQFGINPWTWLRDTLTALPTTPTDQLATLLPTATK